MRHVLLLVIVASCGHASAPATQSQPPTRAEHKALVNKGHAAYDHKDYATCSDALERAGNWYDAASCQALAGHADAAFADLLRADGRDLAQYAADPDLASLHADARWASLGERFADYRNTVNAELLQIYIDDQADRMLPPDQLNWDVIGPRDHAREQRVVDILAAGGAKVADDYFRAAMVFQHGSLPGAIQRAHDLAIKAVELDPHYEVAKWLAAAALDRALMEEHKPQKYGTQFQEQNGVWVLWDVDPTVTDDERDAWNVPPIAEARARAAEMNAQK